MKSVLKLIRVKQWVKNIFVFVPIFFSGEFYNLDELLNAFVAFIVFCFTSSMVYIINDYADIEQDKLHPEKKNRPLASGKISTQQAWIIFALLGIGALLGLYYLQNWKVSSLIAIYFVMNLAYSFKLKHIAIIDVLIISIGFLLRVFVGGYATGVMVSSWTQVLIFSLALLMALGKRRGEMANNATEGVTRKVLDGYSLEFLNYSLLIASSIVIMSYLLFTISPSTESHFGVYVKYTFILVIAGILRYLQQTFVYNKTENPTKMVYKDKFLQIVVLLFIFSFVFLLYFQN